MKRVLLTILSLAMLLPLYGKAVKGRVLCEGKGIAGVVVSDGVSVTQTDARGRYRLEPYLDSRLVFISTPSGYVSSVRRGEGCFWRELEPGESTYDFTLRRNPKDDRRHNVIVIADPQIAEAEEFPELRHNAEAVRDCYDRVAGDYTFGLCLGDIVGWNHALYPEYNNIMDSTGVVFRSVIGNHDMTNYGRSFEGSTRDYEKMYGPSYYSFNVGRVHYIVLNDNFYVGKDWYYIGYLPEAQLRWMERDLSYVGKDMKVVVSLHIPTTLREWDRTGYNFNYSQIADVMCNRKAVYDLLAPYDALILSGHTHTGNNEIITETLMEQNVTSLGGAWWCGPVCVDGRIGSGQKLGRVGERKRCNKKIQHRRYQRDGHHHGEVLQRGHHEFHVVCPERESRPEDRTHQRRYEHRSDDDRDRVHVQTHGSDHHGKRENPCVRPTEMHVLPYLALSALGVKMTGQAGCFLKKMFQSCRKCHNCQFSSKILKILQNPV